MHTIRTQAVNAVREGRQVDVAETFGVNERTMYRWLSKFADGGQKAMVSKPRSGRPPKFTPDQMRWIVRTVRDETPRQMNLPYALWTLSLIQELIHRRLDVPLSLASVGRIMKIVGFSPQKPLYQAWQQDPVLVKRWEQETFPRIQTETKKKEPMLYFADESGLRSDYHRGTTWAPRGETPVVEATGRRFSLNMISAVSPGGRSRFMVHEGTVTAKIFKQFLEPLMAAATKPIFFDCRRASHAPVEARTRVRRVHQRAPAVVLPAAVLVVSHSDEQVWAHVKREVAPRGVGSLGEMKRLAVSLLRQIQKLPSLERAFFR